MSFHKSFCFLEGSGPFWPVLIADDTVMILAHGLQVHNRRIGGVTPKLLSGLVCKKLWGLKIL